MRFRPTSTSSSRKRRSRQRRVTGARSSTSSSSSTRPISIRSSTRRPTTSVRGTRPTHSGSCTRRWAEPARRASAASPSMTGSTSWRCGPATTSCSCIPCDSMTRWCRETTSRYPEAVASPPRRRSTWLRSWSSRWPRSSSPRATRTPTGTPCSTWSSARPRAMKSTSWPRRSPSRATTLPRRSRPASRGPGADMPRALWSGSLSFGLVNVPVQLVSAARDLDYHFHELHEKDKVRIEQRRVCSKGGGGGMFEGGAHSHGLDGKQVIVTDAELASVEPRKTRRIDIEAFVELEDIDPIHFDHPYLVTPAGDSEGTLRAYRLLVEVMSQTDRAALGRFVMRTKEYLAAIRARDGG